MFSNLPLSILELFNFITLDETNYETSELWLPKRFKTIYQSQTGFCIDSIIKCHCALVK